MSLLGFSNNYFDKIAVTGQGSFTRDIRNTYFKNPLKGCLSNLNLTYIGRSENKIRTDC